MVASFVFGSNSFSKREVRGKYTYGRKQFLLTKPEHEFYDVLMELVGETHRVFAQVHLSSIFEHKIKRQSWRGAFSHINGKSVDFVICDKEYISPQLAIELDDSSHGRPDRQERDGDVEHIFEQVGLPLLRISVSDISDREKIKEQLDRALKPN